MSNECVLCVGKPTSAGLAPIRMNSPATGSEAFHPSRNADAAPPHPARPARKGRSVNPAKEVVTAETVLRSFNTWAFKREQPDDPELMLRMISESMALGAPVSFVLYWG